MFGLHSGDGHQLWSMSYPPTVRMAPAPLIAIEGMTTQHLFS